MATITRDSLFSWGIVSRSSQILLLKGSLETLPDEAVDGGEGGGRGLPA